MRLNQSQIDKFIKGQTTKERYLNEVFGMIFCGLGVTCAMLLVRTMWRLTAWRHEVFILRRLV